jgi:hypothetical protein
MALVALALSLVVASVGALGVVSPPKLLNLVRSFHSPVGLYVAAAFRVVLGAALVLAARTSRAPEVLRILGFIILVAGLVTPMFGLERFRRLIEWWFARGPAFTRAWSAVALAFGLLLAYAVLP